MISEPYSWGPAQQDIDRVFTEGGTLAFDVPLAKVCFGGVEAALGHLSSALEMLSDRDVSARDIRAAMRDFDVTVEVRFKVNP